MKRHIYIVLVFSLLAMSVLSGCQYNPKRTRLLGNGDIITLNKSLGGELYSLVITDIYFTGKSAPEIVIDEGLPAEISLSTHENIADTITVTVDDAAGTIRVQGDNKYHYNTDSFKINIGVPLGKVEIDGGYTMELDLPSITEFAMDINGAISGTLDFNQLDSLDVVLNGAGELSFIGQCDTCALTINGAAEVDASELDTRESTISINGAGSCTVKVDEILNAEVAGVGTITYIGSPTVNKKVEGLGTIKQKGE